MVARVASDFWTNPKRVKLERLLKGQFAKSPTTGSMSAGECVCLIWAWLDHRGCPRGSLEFSDALELEDVARWPGDESVLFDALISVGFIVPPKDGAGDTALQWNDYATLNGDTIRHRLRRKKRDDVRDALRDEPQDGMRDDTRDEQGDEKRGSSSSLCTSPSPSSGPGTNTTHVALKPDNAVLADEITVVLYHYKTHHPRSRPGDKALKLVRARLREGYSAQDLCAAIDGNHRDPHCCGDNDRSTEYHDLGLILRDSDHVSRYMAIPERTVPRGIKRAATNIQTALDMTGGHNGRN